MFDYIFDETNKVESDIKNKILLQFENITEEKEAYLKEVFVNCSRFEYAFWDMSYKMEI